MSNLTPEQKRQAAAKRNAGQRRELSGAPEPDEQYDDERPVRRVETNDRRPPARQQSTPGTYGGKPADEPFKPYGFDEIVVDYEGGEFLVTPWVLDDWDDVEAQAEGRGPENEAQEIIQTIKGLLGNDPDRYAGLKQHIRSVHGYVSGNLMLGFIAECRKAAESGN